MAKKRKLDDNETTSNSQKKRAQNELYVAWLPFSFTQQNLSDMCSPFGTVKQVRLMKDGSGKSRGAAFVQMGSNEECLAAIEILHKRTLPVIDSRGPIIVKVAHVNDGDDKKAMRATNLYFSGLPSYIGEDELTELLSADGRVVSVRVFRDRNGVSLYKGMASMSSRDECDLIIAKYNGSVLPDCTDNLIVKYAIRGVMPSKAETETSAGGDAAVQADESDQVASCRLYVSGLGDRMTRAELLDLFSTCGRVSKADIVYYPDGKSRGYGFVHMSSIAECHMAIAKYHNHVLPDRLRTLKVVFARTTEPKNTRVTQPSQESTTQKLTLYVAGLPQYVQSAELIEMFSSCGDVVRADVKQANKAGKPRIGFVMMSSEADCQQAIETFNGADLPDQSGSLTVRKALPTVKNPDWERIESKIQKESRKESRQDFPVNPATSKDNRGGASSQRRVLIQRKIVACNEHLVGLQYLIEFHNENTRSDRDAGYACLLCQTRAIQHSSLISHLTSISHRGLYMMHHHPELVREFQDLGPTLDTLHELLLPFIKRAEFMDGKGMPQTSYMLGVSPEDRANQARTLPICNKNALRYELLGQAEPGATTVMTPGLIALLNSFRCNSGTPLPFGNGQLVPGYTMPGGQGHPLGSQPHQMSGGRGRPMMGGQGPPMMGGQGPPMMGGQGPPMMGGQGPPMMGGQGPPMMGGQGPPMMGGQGPPMMGGQGHPMMGGQGHPMMGGQGHQILDGLGHILMSANHAMSDGQGHTIPGVHGHTMPGVQGHTMPGVQGHNMPGVQGHNMPGVQGPTMFGEQGRQMFGVQGGAMAVHQGHAMSGNQSHVMSAGHPQTIAGQGHTMSAGQGHAVGGQGHAVGGQGHAVGGQDHAMGGQGNIMRGQGLMRGVQGPAISEDQGQMVPGPGQMMPRQGQMMPGKGQMIPGQSQKMPGQGHHQMMPGQSRMRPDQSQMMSGQGQMMPGQGQIMPGHGQMMPGQGQMMSDEGYAMSEGHVDNSAIIQPANRTLGGIFGSSSDISIGMLDKINTDDEAEVALQVSSQITQALINFRMKEENPQTVSGSGQDVINNDEEAEAALQVSSQIAESLIKYRAMRKNAQNARNRNGPASN